MPLVKENPVYDEWEEEACFEEFLAEICKELFSQLKVKKYKRQILYFFHMLCWCEEEMLFRLILFWLWVWNGQQEQETLHGYYKGAGNPVKIEDVRRTKAAIEQVLRMAEIDDPRQCLGGMYTELSSGQKVNVGVRL